MLDPRQQFRVLYRDFLLRLVDLELLSTGGDVTRLFVQFAALLAALSFTLAMFVLPRYAFVKLAPDRLALAATGDQEFLIATTMAVVGVFAVIAWDAVFPDRHDIAILGTLPVRTPTLFQAKVAAVATGLGVSVVAVNIATGLGYPFVAVATGGGMLGALRAAGAYWATMLAAGAFVFCALLSVQGIAAQLLSYRLFLRVSNFLQIAAFFLILGVYFLTPSSSELSVTAPESQRLLARFPSYWFLGLFQELNGPVHAVFGPLAARALWGLSVAIAIAGATYVLAYFRNVRRIVEQPDILPADRSHPAARRMALVLAKLAPKPLERAVILFIARTLSRSRQHRTILAAYCGVGLAISLTYAKILLYGNSQVYAPMRAHIRVPRWYEPNVPLMAAGFVIVCFAIIGARAVFSLPATLKANWIFRITAVHRPGAYFGAVRKSLYWLIAIPVWVAAALLYFSIWQVAPVIAHMVVVALAGIILVERSLYEFKKMPFACSYLPGRSDLKRKLAIYGILFLFVTDVGTNIEFWTMQSNSRYIVLLAILLAMTLRARKRWTAFAAAPYHRLQLEDLEVPDVAPLDLRRDGAWGTERYIDAVDPEPERPLKARIRSACRKAALATMIIAALGAGYEQYGQWQHRRHFPQIGQSVNIGGRSLNIFCSGEGGPTVVFESGAGGPGYAWVFVQREVSRFTRACWYDRAGYGWSDAGPYPRDSAAIARDLNAVLRGAGIAPPYVLAGASFGGFSVRVYNDLYPGEVAGMVLVDSSHVDERNPILNPPPSFAYPLSIIAQILRQIGVARLLLDHLYGSAPPKGMTLQEWAIASSFEPRTMTEHAKELFVESAQQARAARGLGDRPLIVMTAGLPQGGARNPMEARQALANQRHWIEIQAQLARLSTRGKQTVVQNSRHCITCDAPEAVIAAVREVVTETRRVGSPE
jgi:pimeloyl-ACP methyl ester carboxylesterase